MRTFLLLSVIFFVWVVPSCGMEGFGYPLVTDNGQIIASDYRGSGLFLLENDVSSLGCQNEYRGRYKAIHGDILFFKRITSDGQAPYVYRFSTGKAKRFLPPVESCGIMQPAGGGRIIVPYGDEVLLLNNGGVVRRYSIGIPIQWVTVDTVGSRFAFVDDDGYLCIFDIRTEEVSRILQESGFKPKFSTDGRFIALSGMDTVVVVDVATKEIFTFPGGRNPVWDTRGDGVFVQLTDEANYEIVSSDIWYWTPGKGKYSITSTDNLHEAFPVVSPNGDYLSFVSLPDGDVYRADIMRSEKVSLSNVTVVADGADCPYSEPPEFAHSPKSDIWVPYLHQKWDTPDWFNGSWSCGPSSCLMAVQRYSILPEHPITCSYPYSHTHNFGWYVPNEYTFNGYTYDILGLAAGDVWVPGAHGFICREYGGAVWAYMVDFLSQHTLSSWQAAVSWTTFTGEIDAGYPVVASTNTIGHGHIQCFRGYAYNHIIISNDPYGDANTSPWGQYNGEACFYDWPGYDNGLVELDVRQLFIARHSYTPPAADTLVDDLSDGFEYYGPPEYWRAWAGGYEHHIYWTRTVASGDDVNYAIWTPELPAEGEYEVFAYIPSSYATANASYIIHHSGGETIIEVDQSAYSDEWVSLGTYNFADGDYIYIGDVTGTTGDYLGCDAMLFSLRGEAVSDTIVDDGESGFHRYGDVSFWHNGSGGYNSHFWWTYSTEGADTCYVEWYPVLLAPGNYELLVYIPDNHATARARYRIRYRDGEAVVVVDQSVYYNEWVSLGTYPFTGDASEKLYLGDMTGHQGDWIAFDAAWWHYVSPLDVEGENVPERVSLVVCPNPFNSACRLEISVPTDDELSIYNIKGEMVARFELAGGNNSILWKPDNLSSGIYLASTERAKLSGRLLYLK